VGGGPTGVELAGALAEMKKAILPKDYPDLDVRKMQINLIQSSNRILDSMSEKSSQEAEDFLINLGVNVWKNVRVTGYDGSTVTTNTDLTFNSATVIWTAGVQGALPAGIDSNAIIPRAERVKVNEFNQVEGYDNIFAIGDIAAMISEQNPKGHPMMAQPAMQQGKWLGENIVKKINKQALKPFVYNDKGSMATIGRNKAVVDLPKFHFSGVFAWFVWIFVHLFSLIGFKNKAVVLTNWIYNYIRLDREGRLIIRPFKKKNVTSFVADEV
jgi:NADH dehydrogenase